jgi:hypothetical protein
MAIQPTSRILRAATHGRGMWEIRLPTSIVLTFTDDPLVAGTTPIRAIHITELRVRIDTVRARYCQSTPFGYTNPIVAGTSFVTATDITEMRTALAEAYTAAHRPLPAYLNPDPAIGDIVTAAQISDVRGALLAIE